MATYLITGASRGIGLELTKQLLDLPASQVAKVFAVARNVDTVTLQNLLQDYSDRVVLVSAPVDDASSIHKLAETVEAKLDGQGLDVLVNNAGIGDHSPDGIKSMDSDSLAHILDVNVIGVQRVTAALMPLLEQSKQKKIINISSGLGSFAYAHATASMDVDAYVISKAALNMLTLRYAKQYATAGFTVLAISPGWLKTDMGTQYADLSVEVGVAEVKRLIFESGKEDNGRFLNIKVPKTDQMMWEYDGNDIPW